MDRRRSAREIIDFADCGRVTSRIRFTLTEAGATFRDHAARIGAEIERARETILPVESFGGLLRVAMPPTFGPTHFAPVLAEMGKRYLQLQIHLAYSDRFVDLIAEGFDCAIRVGQSSRFKSGC